MKAAKREAQKEAANLKTKEALKGAFSFRRKGGKPKEGKAPAPSKPESGTAVANAPAAAPGLPAASELPGTSAEPADAAAAAPDPSGPAAAAGDGTVAGAVAGGSTALPVAGAASTEPEKELTPLGMQEMVLALEKDPIYCKHPHLFKLHGLYMQEKASQVQQGLQ